MSRRELANYLKRAREVGGFATQIELAGALSDASGQEISQQRVSAYERGETPLPIPLVYWYAQVLKVPEEELALLTMDAHADERVADRVKAFTDKYEELGHTYVRLDENMERVLLLLEPLEGIQDRLARLDGIERRLKNIERHLKLNPD